MQHSALSLWCFVLRKVKLLIGNVMCLIDNSNVRDYEKNDIIWTRMTLHWVEVVSISERHCRAHHGRNAPFTTKCQRTRHRCCTTAWTKLVSSTVQVCVRECVWLRFQRLHVYEIWSWIGPQLVNRPSTWNYVTSFKHDNIQKFIFRSKLLFR